MFICTHPYISVNHIETCFLKRSDYIEQEKLQCSFKKDESWLILSPIEQSIKQKIESIGTPLKGWDIRINRGILTGYNEAFIIDKTKRDELIETDPKSAEIIRPILRGKDIKRYSYNFADKYLITTYNEYTDDNGRVHPSIDMKNYPAIKEYLDSYWNAISRRQDKGDTPYNLRRCAYMDDFNKQKLAWNRIASQKIFGIVPKDIYIQDSMHFITGEHIEYLSAVLNSSLFNWLMNTIVGESAGGNAGNADNVKSLLIMKPTSEIEQKIIKYLRNGDADSIDKLIFQIYSLDKDEIQFISSSSKP
ncbi:TaqI-like C-terminal specificity domain-containing protein [Streptococcus mutans]|uniref:TaqI-like C-terminal specificity domain-containing protein n=1 Tax=Streptococcus mutans TaxID=1309 RepID=UPI00298990FA|nr:TaqI-like C-terminal specificity domain-containing protein [Streptococcus mutans]MDW5564560.1 TaqI-like C-terminal specificity domain-containing protein [Streptococcus mutans]